MRVREPRQARAFRVVARVRVCRNSLPAGSWYHLYPIPTGEGPGSRSRSAGDSRGSLLCLQNTCLFPRSRARCSAVRDCVGGCVASPFPCRLRARRWSPFVRLLCARCSCTTLLLGLSARRAGAIRRRMLALEPTRSRIAALTARRVRETVRFVFCSTRLVSGSPEFHIETTSVWGSGRPADG